MSWPLLRKKQKQKQKQNAKAKRKNANSATEFVAPLRVLCALLLLCLQNVNAICPVTVRGDTKCVPLNVDRKLYSASLLVRLVAVMETLVL
jgi:hypothetical protein